MRISWLDDKTDLPLLDEKVQELEHFTEALADGVIDKDELAAQTGLAVAAQHPQLGHVDGATNGQQSLELPGDVGACHGRHGHPEAHDLGDSSYREQHDVSGGLEVLPKDRLRLGRVVPLPVGRLAEHSLVGPCEGGSIGEAVAVVLKTKDADAVVSFQQDRGLA